MTPIEGDIIITTVEPHRAVARVSDLAAGQLLPIKVDGIEMIVYWVGTRVFAAQRRCLHQGADLADGMILRGSIVCAQHGWRFDAETGVHEMSSENCLVTYRAWIEGETIMIDTTPIRRAESPEGAPQAGGSPCRDGAGAAR